MYVIVETQDGKLHKGEATGIAVYPPHNNGGPCFLDGSVPSMLHFKREDVKTISLFFDDEKKARQVDPPVQEITEKMLER